MKGSTFMRWLYQLQQRIAITNGERNVLFGLVLLLCLGLAARYVQRRARPLPDVDYAAEVDLFARASEAATSEEAPADTTSVSAGAQSLSTPINPNTATSTELQRLPGIGPALAERVVAYREAHGPFRHVQELTRVRGIGAKTLARLKPYLVVSEAESE
jgi:competence protein ComEA